MSDSRPMFTCITCQVAFTSPELQRSHYKSDWHRYNLKRRVAELPPVTAETFQERVLAARAAEERLGQQRQQHYCTDCRKTFSSDKSYENHLRSRKHTDTARKNVETPSPTKQDSRETQEPIENSTDEEESPLETNECLFCSHYEDDLESNLHHMSHAHGFFIPDIEYLTDLKGLVEYLGEKVGVANMCLYCNERGKSFLSVEAVQHHMVDKSHCKLYFEGDHALEYAEYYDYSKSYPDREEERTATSFQEEEVVQSALTVNEDLELVLPSGVTLAHRYLVRHYKQRLPNSEQRKPAVIGRVMDKYRAIGWKGSCDGGKTERDINWALKMKQHRDMKLSVKANKFQKHFRPQVVF